MTLLVAGVQDGKVWIVADTQISGGTLELRDREHIAKIVPGPRSLIGFAGDIATGQKLSEEAAIADSLEGALEILTAATQHGGVDFALAFLDEEAKLFRVSSGAAERVTTLHLGSQAAFETFQRLRHTSEPSFAPQALKIFMAGAPQPVPDDLLTAIRTMCELFATHQDRDVGGWVVPYFLDDTGSHVCDYSYGTSDPVLDDIPPGDIVPHGTQGGGGAQLSFTGLRGAEGWTVYWLQLPGGVVHLKGPDGKYKSHRLSGTPTQFLAKCMEILGVSAELFVSDRPSGAIERISIAVDAAGQPVMVVAGHSNGAMTMSTPNPRSPFVATPRMPPSKDGDSPLKRKLTIELDEKSKSAILKLSTGQSATLGVVELEELLDTLGGIRSQLEPSVPTAFPNGESLRLTDNPSWRAFRKPHPQTAGVVLCIRSATLGWQSFHLPPHEVANLGRYLINNMFE
jgi:hypothetical protein